MQFDSLRAQFEGLPPSAGRALGEVLESGEAKIQVAKATGLWGGPWVWVFAGLLVVLKHHSLPEFMNFKLFGPLQW